MARVHLMADHRRFTGGDQVIEVDGATVAAIVAALDERYPGLGEALNTASSVGLHGEIHAEPTYLVVGDDDDVYFVAPLTGG